MIEIEVSEELKSLCPNFVGAAILADVTNQEHSESLWKEINLYSQELKASISIPDIKLNKNSAATREAYKAFGKDPNRYRPSAEALQRRILRDLPIYQIKVKLFLQ